MKVPSVGGPKVESGYSERFVVERVEDSGTPEAFEGKRNGFTSSEHTPRWQFHDAFVGQHGVSFF